MLERYSGGLGAFDNEQRDHGNLRRFPNRPPQNHSTTGPRSGPLKLNLNTTKCFLNWFSHLLLRRPLKPAAILLSVMCTVAGVEGSLFMATLLRVSARETLQGARTDKFCRWRRVRNYLWLSWSTPCGWPNGVFFTLPKLKTIGLELASFVRGQRKQIKNLMMISSVFFLVS